MNDHQQEEKKQYPLKQQAGFAGGTMAIMSLADLLAHWGPTGLLVGGLVGLAAWRHGPEVYEYVSGQVRGIIPARLSEPSEPSESSEPQMLSSGRSFWDRAFGHYPDVQEDDPRKDSDEDEDKKPEQSAGVLP